MNCFSGVPKNISLPYPKYIITPALGANGECLYALQQFNFFIGYTTLAMNAERNVLEAAIKHLEGI